MEYNAVEYHAELENDASIAEDIESPVTTSPYTTEIVDYPVGEGGTKVDSDVSVGSTEEISVESELNESESSISDSIKAGYERVCDAVNQAAINFANSSKGEATLNAISKARVVLDTLELASDVDTGAIRATLDTTAAQIHMLRGETEMAAELNTAVLNDASTGFSTPAQVDFIQDLADIAPTQTVVVDGPIVDYGSTSRETHEGVTVSIPFGCDTDTAISIAEAQSADTATAEGGECGGDAGGGAAAGGEAGGDSGAGASAGGE